MGFIMRTMTRKINGEQVEFVLLAGIPGLVKIYGTYGHEKPWLKIGKIIFTVQDEYYKLVMDFIHLKYQPVDKQNSILNDFKKLCETYLDMGDIC